MRRFFILGIAIVSTLTVAACSNEQPDSQSAVAKPTILVTGATGTQGGAVARELLSRGYTVRGLSRNPDSEKSRALKELGIEVVKGDFDDPASLLAALDGAYGMFAITNSNIYGPEKEIQHGRNLISAASRANVEHFVFTSVSQAETATGIPHFDSKFEVEKVLYDSGLKYSIVRPVEFMNNVRFRRNELTSGLFVDPRSLNERHQWIAARDIGFMVGEAFDHPNEWRGKAVNIAGDEMTVGEYMEMLSSELDVELTHEQVSWEEFESGWGEEMTLMYRWFEDPGYQVDIQSLRDRYPNLTTMQDYLLDLGWVDTGSQ